MPNMTFGRAALGTLALLVAGIFVRGGEPTREGLEFFERKIRPLLVENCHKCHGVDKPKAELRLDSRAGMLKGSENGPVVVPGHPEKSLIIKALRYEDRDLKMPPRGKLTAAQIADVVAWIQMGAPWPDDKLVQKAGGAEFNLKERSKHWSLQPLKNVPLPAVKNQDWPQSPIDNFLLAALEGKGLAPAARADRRTLLRRVTFDLIGLPPTPAEIDAFLKDDSREAFAKVVDRLLDSPHYGERWARHWLDLVRYAETYGHEFDFDIPEAWRYRDYVIRAFNDDVPFDQFVREHIAGDRLPEPRRHPQERFNESILGTGFWWFGEAKHSPVDVRGDQADRIDNQIDVFGKTFLGMTVACARCHDHKFDAISTKDYYALAGLLQSSRQDRAFVADPAPRREYFDKLRALHEKAFKLAAQQTVKHLRSRGGEIAKKLVEGLVQPLTGPKEFIEKKRLLVEGMRQQQARHERGMVGVVVFADARRGDFERWFGTGEAFTEPGAAAPVLLNFSSPSTALRILPAHGGRSDRLSSELHGALRSPTFTLTKNKIHYRAAGRDVRINLVLDGLQLIREPIYGGLTFTVNSPPPPKTGEPWKTPPSFGGDLGSALDYRWYTQDVSMWLGHRAYIEVLDEGPGTIALDGVVFSDEAAPPDAPNALLLELLSDPRQQTVDDLTKAIERTGATLLEQWESGKLLGLADARARTDFLHDMIRAAEPRDEYVMVLGRWNKFHKADLKLWEAIFEEGKRLAAWPSTRLEPVRTTPLRALATADGSAVDEHVFLRGNHKKLGEVVPRRFLEVFGGTRMKLPEQGSGRLELARQMVDPFQTPILPRVLVNRLWKHHFGEGIVRSVDDFGVLGQTPTHPELLDYLAVQLIKQGWSIKQMHRMMVLSSAYQMASKADASADEADPENRLLHKMPVRRLEAEAVRDAILAVSGRLDRTLFGPSVPPHLTEFMVGRGRPKESGPLDGNGRRSIYLAVRRNFLEPMFLAFDFPTPFSTMGRRSVSNVPAQALTMMNNPFVLRQAELWSQRVLADARTPARERIGRMYLAAFGRPPSTTELTDLLAFVQEQGQAYDGDDAARVWRDLCHVLFNTKEFIFVP